MVQSKKSSLRRDHCTPFQRLADCSPEQGHNERSACSGNELGQIPTLCRDPLAIALTAAAALRSTTFKTISCRMPLVVFHAVAPSPWQARVQASARNWSIAPD